MMGAVTCPAQTRDLTHGRLAAVTRQLVALDLPAGPEFVAAFTRVWDDGDAAFPIDQRLPPPAKAAQLAALAVTLVRDADGSEHRQPGGRPVEDGDALVMATSGSTGDPKGVVLTHDAVAASASASSARLGVTTDDHWLACLPLSHVGGLAVVTRALAAGTAPHGPPRVRPTSGAVVGGHAGEPRADGASAHRPHRRSASSSSAARRCPTTCPPTSSPPTG